MMVFSRTVLPQPLSPMMAKVWPRESEEPADWTIKVTDPTPNTEGSAGLYGYSTNTTAKSDGPKIFYDNFKVTR